MSALTLNQEICIFILESLGILPYSKFGQQGISQLQFQIPQQDWPCVEYDDGQKIKYPIYAGKIDVGDNNFQVVLFNLALDPTNIELYLFFKLKELPIHCLSFIQTEDNFGTNLSIYQKQAQQWISLNIISQAQNLIGFETLSMSGFAWQPHLEYQQLLELGCQKIF